MQLGLGQSSPWSPEVPLHAWLCWARAPPPEPHLHPPPFPWRHLSFWLQAVLGLLPGVPRQYFTSSFCNHVINVNLPRLAAADIPGFYLAWQVSTARQCGSGSVHRRCTQIFVVAVTFRVSAVVTAHFQELEGHPVMLFALLMDSNAHIQ